MKKTLFLLVLLAYFNNTKAQLSPPAELQSYYNNVDFSLTGTQLFNDLAAETISKHSNILDYVERHNYLYNADEDLSNTANVLLMYSGESRDKREYLSGGNSFGTQTFNTEHVYPQSLIDNTARGDLHHLRSCDISVNSARGNNPFSEGSGAYQNNGSSWFPGDDWKGDVARMIMYLNLRYNESFNDVGSLSLFLKWNVEDPVSDFEKQRNEVIAAAQGNRNPFIDNPFLATVIWGGTSAENTWGEQDDEAPTTPTNISLSNITASTISASWSAASDNVGVTKYEIYANGNLNGETTTENYVLTGLMPNTAYGITVLAQDASNNKSAQSNPVNATTLTDSEAPSIPTNVTISNQTASSFRVNWVASTDNTAVANYDVFVDGNLNGSTANTSYDVTNLTISTTYSIAVLAKDSSNNSSAQSNPVNGTTSDGTSDVSELFFSEYVEGSGFNKAIEIVNLTSNNVDLSSYTVKRQSGGNWESPLSLSGYTVNINDVFVIINSSTTDAKLMQESDLEVANSTPMTFNGDDRVGLFKNDVLIDIIGDLDGTNVFAQNVTLRRNTEVKAPNTNFSEQGEWTTYPSNTTSDIGNFNGTLSTENDVLENFKMYPNPIEGNTLYFNTDKDLQITIFNVLGKKVKSKNLRQSNNSIDVSELSKGIYLVKINSNSEFITKKLIKK